MTDISTPARARAPSPFALRLKAAGIHLGLSILVACLVVAGMLFVWFPPPYFYGLDGLGMLTLLVAVDVVIGPLITLVIVNPGKKGLKFDLAVIALLQLGALVYGIFMMAQARPVYAVYNEGRFDVIIANELNPAVQAKATNPEYRATPWFGPKFVAMDVPADKEELNRMILSGTNTRAFTQYYVSYPERAAIAAKTVRSVGALAITQPESAAKVRDFIANKSLSEDHVGWLPFYTRANDLTAVLRRDTGELVGIVQARPGN
jgi:hypothetical protein